MAKNNQKPQETLKPAFVNLLRTIFIESRSFLGYDIKIISSASYKSNTRISKEALYRFENGEDCLTKEQLLFLAKFYNVTLKTILDYVHRSEKIAKELKKNNNDIKEQHADELTDLVGFSGYKERK